MRGALEPFEGLKIVDLEKGKKPFKIQYDPKKVDLAKVIAALEKAGEPVTKM